MKTGPVCMREIELTRGEIDVSLHRVDVNRQFPLHWHEYFELEIVLSGGGEHICNGKRYEVGVGDAWLMSYCDFHSFVPRCNTEIINVSFSKDVLSKELEERLDGRGICGRIDPEHFLEIRALCKRLLHEFKNADAFSALSCKGLITYLTVALLRNAGLTTNRMTAPSIRAAVAYMHEHFREDISLLQVARTQGLSPNYFGKLFCETVGVPFREYLNKLRLRYACDLLVSADLSVGEIAREAGYLSVEYFFSVFKKQLSVTPLHYRRAECPTAEGSSK